MLGWVILFLPYAIVAALIVFGIARGLEYFRTPRAIVAIICAVLSALFTGYLVVGFGWFIAIGASPVYFSMFLGLIFGGVLLPRWRIRRVDGA
jgi:hypothetical protein